MLQGRLDQGISVAGDDELVTALVRAPSVRIERIVSRGHASPPGFWYDQSEAEFVLVVNGRAVVEFDSGERLNLSPGDYVDIPPRRRHRVAWTAPDENTVWLAIFYGEGQ